MLRSSAAADEWSANLTLAVESANDDMGGSQTRLQDRVANPFAARKPCRAGHRTKFHDRCRSSGALFQHGQPAALFNIGDVKGDYERVRTRGGQFKMPPTNVTAYDLNRTQMWVYNDSAAERR